MQFLRPFSIEYCSSDLAGGVALRTVQINRANGQAINPGPLNKVLASSATSDENKVVKIGRAHV